MHNLIKKFIGDKSFYKHVLMVAVPIMIQNGITNFVSLLDNIMVGRVGTEQMSGVAIVNQILMIYNLCVFGGVAGAGIFTAQFYGEGNARGIRHTFRFKIWMAAAISFVAALLLFVFGENFISLYLSGTNDGGDTAAALMYGKQYLRIMLLSLLPFMMLQVYSGTLRECGETIVPMKAGMVAVLVNLVLDYTLIYGKFGVPVLGVRGAAIATVIARYAEAAVVIVWTHRHKEKNPYADGLYKTLLVPAREAKQYLMKGLPLMVNETLWSGGMATLMQCYSVRGMNVVAGLNISNTINNVFNVVFIAFGDAVAIIIGQLLGAGKMREARDTDNKLIAFSVMSCIVISGIMLCIAPLFPQMYNTTELSKEYAARFIRVQAAVMPMVAFLHATYFTLRSGGKTLITFLFDSAFMWCVSIPAAFVISRFTSMDAVHIFITVQLIDLIKCTIGFILVKKGVWLNNMVSEKQS